MLAILLIVAHVVAAAVLLLYLPFGVWQLLAMIALLAGSAWYCVRRHALLNVPSSIVGLKWIEEGKLELLSSSGDWSEEQLGAEQFVNPHLTIVSYRRDATRGTRHIVIVSDMLDADSFRQLRGRLKWRR